MMKNASTTDKVNQCISAILAEFDTSKAGVLYKKDAKSFYENVLIKMKGNGCYSMTVFEDWFIQYDKDFAGAIEQPELVEFITKVALTETGGHNIGSQPFSIKEGKRYCEKMVRMAKIGQLDYLTICELVKKIFKFFDLDGNAVLDKSEGKFFLDALTHEMNFASTSMSRDKFKKWFADIDEDGSGAISVNELIPALAQFFKVPIPLKNNENTV